MNLKSLFFKAIQSSGSHTLQQKHSLSQCVYMNPLHVISVCDPCNTHWNLEKFTLIGFAWVSSLSKFCFIPMKIGCFVYLWHVWFYYIWASIWTDLLVILKGLSIVEKQGTEGLPFTQSQEMVTSVLLPPALCWPRILRRQQQTGRSVVAGC